KADAVAPGAEHRTEAGAGVERIIIRIGNHRAVLVFPMKGNVVLAIDENDFLINAVPDVYIDQGRIVRRDEIHSALNRNKIAGAVSGNGEIGWTGWTAGFSAELPDVARVDANESRARAVFEDAGNDVF